MFCVSINMRPYAGTSLHMHALWHSMEAAQRKWNALLSPLPSWCCCVAAPWAAGATTPLSAWKFPTAAHCFSPNAKWKIKASYPPSYLPLSVAIIPSLPLPASAVCLSPGLSQCWWPGCVLSCQRWSPALCLPACKNRARIHLWVLKLDTILSVAWNGKLEPGMRELNNLSLFSFHV